MVDTKVTPITKFGEEIPRINLFSFAITSRCNMNCNFCFQKGRSYYTGKDMTFEEFKHIIDQIAKQESSLGKHPVICIAGGEPFLNKDLAKMSKYATSILGNNNVGITTNLALFPTTVPEAIALFRKFGLPRFNVSIDREHLRYGKEMETRISTFFAAAKHAKVNAEVQSVAQTNYQEKYPWPKNISRLIPKEIKANIAADSNYGRREFYSYKAGSKRLKEWIKDMQKGNKLFVAPYSVMLSFGMPGVHLPIELHFATDGRAYIFSGINALHVPQLSVGNWRRESIKDITKVNLPFKMNMFRHWLGMVRVDATVRHPTIRMPEVPSKQKVKLFGNYAMKQFKKQAKQMRNKMPR